MAKHRRQWRIKQLDKTAAMKWLHVNDGADAHIAYTKHDLAAEEINGRLWVDLHPVLDRPHVLIVSDTFSHGPTPLVRAAVALHLSEDMSFTLNDEKTTQAFATLDISRGDSLRSDATLGDESVRITV